MKFLSLFLLMFTSLSARAETFFCRESSSEAIRENRLQYAVWVKEIAPITDKRVIRDNDSAEKVIVSVMSRDPNGSAKFVPVQTFKAVAKKSDVMYSIDAKQNGLSMMIYLDELDQTSVHLLKVGKKLQMTCDGSEHRN